MNDGGVQRADRYDLDAYDAMLRIEHHDAELLDRVRAVQGQEVRGELARRIQAWPFIGATHQRPATQLDCSEHLCGACPTNPAHVAERAKSDTGEAVQASGLFQQ